MPGSALPPDVRRWLCPAVKLPFENSGYALGAAFGPLILGAEPEPGA